MAKLIKKLQRFVRLAARFQDPRERGERGNLPPMNRVLNDTTLNQLMQMIKKTGENEYSCEETFALLDEYVELALNDQDAAALFPLVKLHIDLCVDCHDTYEMLIRAMGSQPAVAAE